MDQGRNADHVEMLLHVTICKEGDINYLINDPGLSVIKYTQNVI